MATARYRIVSDLHVGDLRSLVREVRQLAPLLDGTDQLVLNGDTIETRFLDLDPHARAEKAEFDAFAAAHRPRITTISGNHDPDVSAVHHLDLEEGRVLVTHGDTLFPEMAPWGWEARHFRAEQERRLAAVPEPERASWETRLRVFKETMVAIRHLSPQRPDRFSHPWLRRLQKLTALPRLHRMWKAWREAPSRAAGIAEDFRPDARFVIVGHVHRPGVWSCRGRTIVNTGSAIPPMGALAVDCVGRRLLLRKLRFTREGVVPGPVQRIIDLDSPTPSAGGGPPVPEFPK